MLLFLISSFDQLNDRTVGRFDKLGDRMCLRVEWAVRGRIETPWGASIRLLAGLAAYSTRKVAAYSTRKVATHSTSKVVAYSTRKIAAYSTSKVAACWTSKVAAYSTSSVSRGLHPRLLLHFYRLDLVTDFDVVELAQSDTALEVGAHLGDIVFEAT